MKEKKQSDIMPVQPYIMIHTDDYEQVIAQKIGISHFYEFTREAGSSPINAVPDGSVDLVFGINGENVKSYIGGTVLKAKNWPLEDGRTYFGVRFLPGKCVLPKELSIKEIVNDDLELDGNTYGMELAEKIAEAGNIYERSGIFMDYYMETLRKKEVTGTAGNIESYVRNRIYESKGNISIGELAAETGYSECYIRRVFGEVHGISPKVFEKIVRFQNMLDRMDKESFRGIGDIALESGYYDQSHMIKDFKNYTGMTPEHYQKLLNESKAQKEHRREDGAYGKFIKD